MIQKTDVVAKIDVAHIAGVEAALAAMAKVVQEEISENGKFSFSPLESYSLSDDGSLQMTLQHIQAEVLAKNA